MIAGKIKAVLTPANHLFKMPAFLRTDSKDDFPDDGVTIKAAALHRHNLLPKSLLASAGSHGFGFLSAFLCPDIIIVIISSQSSEKRGLEEKKKLNCLHCEAESLEI